MRKQDFLKLLFAPVKGWILSAFTYTGNTINVETQAGDPRAVSFNPDGTKMYVCDTVDDFLYQYSLSPAWDITTATYDSVSYDFVSSFGGFSFKPDGTKLYKSHHSSVDRIEEFSLSPAWDITSLTTINDQSGFGNNPSNVRFNATGTKMYVLASDTITQYSADPAWESTSATTDSITFDFGNSANGDESTAMNFVFHPEGTYLYLAGRSKDAILQYSLGEAWDLSTISYDAVQLDISTQQPDVTDLYFTEDGRTLFIIGEGNNDSDVHEYSM